MDRQTKENTIADLQGRFATATAMVLTDFTGVTVEEVNNFRRQLQGVEGEYRVAKNTLVSRAIEGTPYGPLKDLLTGQNGLVFGYGDIVALAKVVARYATENGKLAIKAGVTEGQLLETSGVEALATLPSREALQAQLLGVITQPATRLVGVLSGSAGQLARLLSERASQLNAD